MAVILPVDPERPQAALLREAADLLRSGQLVAMPTETVYGLAGLAPSRRPRSRPSFAPRDDRRPHPLIAHVLDQAGARKLVKNWPAQATVLADRFWPGPLTLVLERDPSVPAALSGGKPTVAVRVPSPPGEPGAAGRAGRADRGAQRQPLPEPVADPGRARAALAGRSHRLDPRRRPDAAGAPGRRSSTSPVPKPRAAAGALVLGELRASSAPPDRSSRPSPLASESERHSPGQDLVHYAPRARLEVLPRRQAIERARATPRAGLILRAPLDSAPEHEPAGPTRVLPGLANRIRARALCRAA